MAVFFIFIAILLILINIYDGFQIRKCFGRYKKFYYMTALPIHIIFLGIFMAMFFTRGSEVFAGIRNALNIIGYGFITASFYMFLLFLISGIVRFIFNKLKFSGRVRNIISKVYAKGITVIVISFLAIVYGVYNASDISVSEYRVSISKDKGNIKGLNSVMFSDTHIGTTIKEKELDEIVQMVNALKPDIIFLCGDIFDEGTSQHLKEYASDAFSKFQSGYGTYYITGNHEYYAGDSDNSIKYMEDAGINVLKDEYVFVNDSFYVVGRADKEVFREDGIERKELTEILNGIDKDYPIILLDHRPVGINLSKDNGVDLQFSGHTHAGQIFPINFLSSISNDLNYGYLKNGDFNIVVSSGCGTWGVPIRIGSDTEIVNVKIN
ncbi:MAG: metallophosphoesterase [Clostridiales bacterium]|nr:metallophosphoesterase [Clostridiales bacterium]